MKKTRTKFRRGGCQEVSMPFSMLLQPETLRALGDCDKVSLLPVAALLPKHKPISDLIIYFYDPTVSVKTNRDIVDTRQETQD